MLLILHPNKLTHDSKGIDLNQQMVWTNPVLKQLTRNEMALGDFYLLVRRISTHFDDLASAVFFSQNTP